MTNFLFDKIDVPGGAGTNGFVYISVNGVDSSGLAVGNVSDTDGDSHGFTVAPDEPWTQYDPPTSSNQTYVIGITPGGEIYGDFTDWSNVQHGFVVNGGVTTTIDVPFASATNISGVTASGELFGSYVYGGEVVEAFIDNNGTFATIVDPAGQSTSVSGVNAAGVIVGAITDSQFVVHAFVDNGGTFTTLNPAGSYSSSAVGVTASGEVVGTYEDTSNNQFGFTYDNGAYTKISVAGSTDNVISYVSDSGEIVGYYLDATGHSEGFIDQNGVITTIMVPGAANTEIMGINPAGEIYGDYNDNSGQHGFVGMPYTLSVSAPATVQAIQGGAAIALSSAAPSIENSLDSILTSATIQVTGASGNPVSGDELTIDGQQSGTVDGGLVTVNWNDTTKALTLTGDAPLADYQTLLGEITYQDNGIDNSTGSHPQHTVTWTINDGEYSNSNTSEVTVERAPVDAATNITLNPNALTIAASSMVTASDPDGDAVTTYAFRDTGDGHFILNGVVEPNNQEIDVTAAQLSELTYQNAGGTDTVQTRVSDGTLWSNWQSFTVTGPTATAIHTDGSTELAQIGNNYYLESTSTGIGPELTQGGAAVGPDVFKAVGAVQVSGGGYDVAWQEIGSSVFTIWSVDSHGNFISSLGGNLAGSSTALENFETIFGQDLNGDGTIGAPLPPPPTTVSVDGNTTLVESGNNYYLDVTGSSSLGPELTQGGVAVGPDVFKAVGAVQVSGGGYDVAWQEIGSSVFTIWSVDSHGNFISSLGGNLAGSSTALENFETIFGQDLNGDGTIGPPPPPPPTTISVDGNTTLVQSGNNYYLDVTGSSSLGPELTQGGVAVGPEVFKAVGAVQVAGGYDVAWQEIGSSVFTIWSVDSHGNFISSLGGNLAGNSATLENFETIFGQDLNGDGTIGAPPPPPPTTIAVDGNTTLVQSGNNYYLDVTGSSSLGPELTQGGVAVGPDVFKAVGAVQVAGGGYDVAWQEIGSSVFTIWSVDSHGNFISSIGSNLAGNSAALENFETVFGQDLNGDGTIGAPPPTTISHDGDTTLVQSGNNYYLDVTGSSSLGPELTQGGVAVGPEVFKAVGAVHVSGGGYDVAWQQIGSSVFTIWSVDSNGNFISSIGSNLAGNSAALENFETIFGQDLNGNGSVGSSIQSPSIDANSVTDHTHTHAHTAPVSVSSTETSDTGPATPNAPSTAAGDDGHHWHGFKFADDANGSAPTPSATVAQLAGHDGFVFTSNAQANPAHFTAPDEFIHSNGTAFANISALFTDHHDAHGNAVFPDAAHDAIAHWSAHTNFHLV